MKILDNTKSLSTLVSDTSNGLGQIQPLSCVVTEELNGIYELDFTVNVNDKHYNDLKNSGLVKVTVGDGSEQIFRIYKIDEPINMISSVHCQHITYDLSKVVVKPFTATGAVNIKNQLVSNMLGSYPFSTWTDITNTTSTFTNDIPRYFRECLGGYEGSVLDVLRPEYEWDNLTVKLHARRGSDNGVRISYGKNLIDYSQEQNNENVYDGVYGYAVVDEQTYKADSYYNKTGATYPRILNVDFSSDYESGQIPTPSELLQKATTYAQNNSIEVPSINIKIDFIPLWQTEEYKNILPLERVSLGDTVHVYFDKLNVEASSRVIKTTWNVLTQKYDSIELGDAKANLNTIINDSVSTAVDEAVSDLDIDVGWLDTKAENMFKLIANGVGLHITKDSQGRIILHNDEDITRSKYQYMITAQGFMMSDDYGQEGSWRSGWTTSGDAYMNSLSTITLRALDIYGATINGTVINFGDLSDKYITAQVYNNSSDVPQGVSFDGSGTIRLQPQEQFLVRNKAVGSNYAYNTLSMSNTTSDTNQGYITLVNYDDLHGYKTANRFYLYSHYGTYSSNQIGFSNFETSSGTGYLSNSFAMSADSTSRLINFINRKVAVTTSATIFALSASTTQDQVYIYNYHLNMDKTVNQFLMTAKNAEATVEIKNNDFADCNNMANNLVFSTTSADNTITLTNYSVGSEQPKNILTMEGSKAKLWSANDNRIWSGGAVRISANVTSSGSNNDAGQDVHITGKTLHVYYDDKISFHKNGARYDLNFNSGGSVTWSS